MACFRPIDAWRLDDGTVRFQGPGAIPDLRLPCGQCIGCRVDRAKAWSLRCMHEAQMSGPSSFVTLTYDDAHCPRSLVYADFRNFMRRLRREFGKVRYFMCGEYGETLGRPHFHALLFGVFFEDRQPIREGEIRLYRSSTLERLWPDGFSSIGDVTAESAEYVARYSLKKVTGRLAKAHYTRLDPATGEMYEIVPEFLRMSLKPGIGASWIDRYGSDVFSGVHDGVMCGNRKFRAPRYYDERMRKVEPDLMEGIDLRRYRQPADPGEKSPERLAVREECLKAKLDQKVRKL